MYEGLLDVFDKYGYYLEDLQSLTLKGIEGAKQIQAILNEFRENPPDQISGHQVVVQEDYLSRKKYMFGANREEAIKLPKSNVLKYFLEDGTWVCLRPSGTEPKIKFYFGVQGSSMKEAKGKLSAVMKDFMRRINNML
ncbi:Phosphoglucomutase [Peribacillus simplex]|nr:Phosphoglucomutase [Peribacillus simplex]